MAKFRPGVSGNPKGRPKKTINQEWERQLRAAVPEAIRILVGAMRNADKFSDRLTAARLLLERALGKPADARPDGVALRELPRVQVTVVPLSEKDG